MALRPRVAVLLTLLACALPSTGAAQSRVTVRIATQSPLSAEQAARGDEIRLGAQLALEQLGGPLERLGFRLELAAFDDQGRPDIAVANAKNIVASKEILAVIGRLDARVAIPASEIYKEVSLAMVAPAGTDTLLTDRGLPGVNRVSGRDDVQGTGRGDLRDHHARGHERVRPPRRDHGGPGRRGALPRRGRAARRPHPRIRGNGRAGRV